MTSVVLVDTGGTVVEYVAAEEDPQQVGCTQTQARVTLQLSSIPYFCLIENLFMDCLALSSLNPICLQEGECEEDQELEGEVEGVCEAEEAYEEVQDRQEAEDFPAVIVEEVPGASLAMEQGYSAQVLVYEDEAFLMQEVDDEQEVEAEEEAGEINIPVFIRN